MKFAHMGDCHLGGWRHQKLKELNFKSFQLAVDRSLKEKVEFVLLAGDLFDTPYPPIDTLKDTFAEFRKLKEANIPVFLIAGSHDYSASGKTFLDVLERAGLCTNVSQFEERNGSLLLLPTLYKNVALYGYPGKKSGLEVDELENVKIQDSPGLFKILLLHTVIRDAVGSLPIKAVDQDRLPKVDYLALAHLHINYQKEGRVYSGPIFPNNLSELEELKRGFFYLFNNGKISKEELQLKQVISLRFEIKDALHATESILNRLEGENLLDKIVILRFEGSLERGRVSDIDFSRIESLARSRGAYVVLRSTSKLYTQEPEMRFESLETANIEQEALKRFEETHSGPYNDLIPQLMKTLIIERMDDEKVQIFEERVIAEAKKVFKL